MSQDLPVFTPFPLLEIIGDDPELFAAMMAEFRINAADYAAQLSSAHSTEAWVRAAHKLKGSARGFGALALADAAAEAEVAPTGDRQRMDRIRHEIDRLNQLSG